jgi:hypothetical protein
MKTCSCGVTGIKNFNKNRARKDGLQAHCRECQKTRSKNHYALNSEMYKEKSRKKRLELTAFIEEIKRTNPCKDCENFFNPWQMDFDHLDGEDKVERISALLNTSKEVLLAEIAKCDLVCANCHRDRTHDRMQSAA